MRTEVLHGCDKICHIAAWQDALSSGLFPGICLYFPVIIIIFKEKYARSLYFLPDRG
jgi:hypothetical protein